MERASDFVVAWRGNDALKIISSAFSSRRFPTKELIIGKSLSSSSFTYAKRRREEKNQIMFQSRPWNRNTKIENPKAFSCSVRQVKHKPQNF